MKITLNGEIREITIAPLTRGIARQINDSLLKGVSIEQDSFTGATKLSGIPVENQTASEQLAVALRTGLTDAEINSLLVEDYQAILVAISEQDAAQKKSSAK